MSDANETVIRRYVDDVSNNGDYSVLPDLIHSGYVYRSPDQEFRGRQALQALFTAYRSRLPDPNVSIDDLVTSGDKVVISITLSGTHTGDLM